MDELHVRRRQQELRVQPPQLTVGASVEACYPRRGRSCSRGWAEAHWAAGRAGPRRRGGAAFRLPQHVCVAVPSRGGEGTLAEEERGASGRDLPPRPGKWLEPGRAGSHPVARLGTCHAARVPSCPHIPWPMSGGRVRVRGLGPS